MRVQRLPTRTPKGASRRKKREHNKPRSAFLILSVTLEVLLECNVLSGGVHCTTAHFEHETVIRGLPLISLFKRKSSGIAPHWSCSLDECMTWISFPLECGDTDPFSNRFNRLKQGQRLSSIESVVVKCTCTCSGMSESAATFRRILSFLLVPRTRARTYIPLHWYNSNDRLLAG